MWLVLCDANDASARWAAARLQTRLRGAVERFTAGELALAEFGEHRIDGSRTTLRFRVEGRPAVDGAAVDGVLNRLCAVPHGHWRRASDEDRAYVQQEMAAFTLSWLHALPCPVINRPSPQGLCGRWRQESEWVVLARRAGLPVGPYRLASTDDLDATRGERRLVRPGMDLRTAVVIGSRTVGAMPEALVPGCLRLAGLAETDLIGIDFAVDAGGAWTFAGAHPMPDLRAGGDAVVDGLVDVLDRSATTAREAA